MGADMQTSVPELKSTKTQIPEDQLPQFSQPWHLQQSWLDAEQEGFQAGTVSMAWTPENLHVFAMLPDEEVFSASTDDNQEMWTLGDVFEIFVRREDSPTYLELHVTPNAHQLHLRLTAEDFENIRLRKAELHDFQADARAFTAEIKKLSGQKAWVVFARIPASILPNGLPFRAGDRLLISFSRYDTDGKGMNVVLSSTSPHHKLCFHRQQEWREVVLE